MKRISMLVLVTMVLAVPLIGLQDVTGIYSESINITRTGMYVLGGWAAAKIGAGIQGFRLAINF